MSSGKGARLTMKLDDKELRGKLAEIAKKGGDVRPVFKKLGAWMAFRSVATTFRKQGRPKWKALSDYTMAMREWRSKSPNAPSPRYAKTGKILVVTGGLKGSFTFVARPKRLDVGTAHENADAHQFGKSVPAPKRWKRARVRIPKRQLIGIHPEDEKKAVEFAEWHLKKLVPGAK